MRYLLAVAFLAVSGAVSAATSYVVPWYANPVATNVAYDAALVNDPADPAVAAKIDAAWSAVSGADALSGKTASVKTMSDTTYFRPKFYVLCTDGDVVEFTMSKDLSSAVWTNTLTAATLAGKAGASGAASDLQVSDDGRLAFLDYGGIWKALGYKAPAWTLHVLDASGDEVTDATVAKRDYLKWGLIGEDGKIQYLLNDIQSGGSAYITDGTWKIRAYNHYGAVGLGIHGDPSVNAFIGDGVGEYLDFSAGTAAPAFENSNKSIRWNTEYALGVPAGGRTARVIVHSPKLETVYKIMGGWAGGYEEVVIDTELPKGSSAMMAQYGDGFTPTVKRLVFNVPGFTVNNWGAAPYAESSSTGIPQAFIATESRWDDFNFNNISNASGAAFYNFDCGGTLSLPVITNIGQQAFACYSAAHENTEPVEVLLSPENKTLQKIGRQAFLRQTNIWRVVIGGHEDGVLFDGAGQTYAQQFSDVTSLKEVEFTGGLPLFGENTPNNVFATSKGAKAYAFIVPREERWANFLADSFRLANDNEIRDYMAANPGRYVPFGVVTNNSLFHTSAHQFVAYADSFGGKAPLTFAADFDSGRGSVSATVVSGNEPDEFGRYEPGTVVRLTAVPASGCAFRKWYGDIGTNDAASTSIDLAVEDGKWVFARFTKGWTITDYDASTGKAKATDGNFRINLSAMDAASHSFTLGDPDAPICGLFDVEYTDNGDGTVTTNMLAGSKILDLGGDFMLEGYDTPWRAVSFADQTGICAFPMAYLGAIDTFISPGTLTVASKRALFNFNSAYKASVTSFASVIYDEPSQPGEIKGYNFAGASRVIKRLVLQIPSVQTLLDNAFWNIQASDDLATWDLSSVTSITPKAMTTQYIVNNDTSYLKGRKAFNCHGDLSLPALRAVVRSDAAGSALSPMPYLTGLTLGGKTSADTVTSLCDGAFAGNSSMTNLTIHADAEIVVGTGIFGDREGYDNGDVVYSGHVPEEIVFTGAAPENDIFANLLADVGAGDAPVRVRAKKAVNRWWSRTYIDYETTAEERALAGDDAGKVFGAYRDGAILKALFIAPEPPKGMCILFR